MTRYAPQWLQQSSYAASVDRRLIGALWPAPASTGCAVTVSSGMTVNIATGQVAVPTQNNTGTTLCSSDAVEQVTLTAAPASGTNRYDKIICRPRGNDLDGGSNNDFIFDYVTGTAAATPTVPATPAGTVALAQIYVPGGSAAITAANIVDLRPGALGVPAGRTDPAWITVTTFANNWVSNASAGFYAPAYRMLNGRVMLRGNLRSGTLGGAAFFLPAGYWPANNMQFPAVSAGTGFGFIQVTSNNGAVQPVLNSNTAYALESVSFDPSP